MDEREILDKVSDFMTSIENIISQMKSLQIKQTNVLRLARLKQRISQEKLAEMVNISTKYLNMIENRKANPTIVIVIKICNALNIQLNSIYQSI